MISGVPSVDTLPVTSRHLPELVLTSSWPWTCQACAPLPLQLQSCTGVLLVVPLPDTSMHMPCAWIVPSEPTVHICEAEPLQVLMTSWVPNWPSPESMHLPPIPVIWPVPPPPPPPPWPTFQPNEVLPDL